MRSLGLNDTKSAGITSFIPLFNERENNVIKTIYGVVTTGTAWKFLKLTGQIVEVDLSEYYLNKVNKILGILASFIPSQQD